MTDKAIVRYPGKKAEVSWDGRLCIHIGECGRAKGDLFVGGRQPWCDPDVSGDEEIRDVVMRCPTGALSVEFGDGAGVETPDPVNTVHVTYNGPLFFRGNLEIEEAPDDVPGLRFRAALCRCGASKNKPFCDNSHADAGFADYGAVGDVGNAGAASGGALHVAPSKDGPLIVSGNMTMLAGSGRAAWKGKQVALCRCGASENKPFCDGRHKKVGFKSD
ncbi:MAG: CDGSH iron-sulfur domain-containing protein [Gammaproteobacteria bacterium]|nr:CDGSH iron-sulfur domain-containing protein [Gammaproteobacteria bacterium]